MTARFLGFCAAAALALWPAFPPQAQEVPIASFSGDGDQITASFEVEDGWIVNWEVDAGYSVILLKGTKTGAESIVANPSEPGSGRTVYLRGGTFHFEVRSLGPWSLEVFDNDLGTVTED